MKNILKRVSALLATSAILLSTSFATSSAPYSEVNSVIPKENATETFENTLNNNPEDLHYSQILPGDIPEYSSASILEDPELNPPIIPSDEDGKTDITIPFKAKVTYTTESIAVMGTIEGDKELLDLLKESTSIVPFYSLDGKEFIPNYDMSWYPIYDGKITNYCFIPSITPLKEYLAGEIDEFWVKLGVSFEEFDNYGDIEYKIFSETSRVFRITGIHPEDAPPLPSNYQYDLCYPKNINVVEYPRPIKVYGLCNISVPVSTANEDIINLLPEEVSVELQIQQGSAPVWKEPFTYNVVWDTTPIQTENGLRYAAKEVVLPDYIAFQMEDAYYKIEPAPPIGYELYCDVSFVDTSKSITHLLGYLKGNLLATLPNKPTSATSVVGEYSIDGGSTWLEALTLTDNIDINAVPNVKEYSGVLLDNSFQVWQDYLDKKIDGFYTRLKINDGYFEGITEIVAWPTDYKHRPIVPGGDGGSEGNRGDAGDSNNDTDGVRPNLPSVPHTPAPETVPEIVPQIDEAVTSEIPVANQYPKPFLSNNDSDNSSDEEFELRVIEVATESDSTDDIPAVPTNTRSERETQKPFATKEEIIVPIVSGVAALAIGKWLLVSKTII